MTYRYGTVLRVLNDDPHDNAIEEGTIIIEAGKLEDGDSYTTIGPEKNIVTVEMETLAIYDNDEASMSESEAKEFARKRFHEEHDGEVPAE